VNSTKPPWASKTIWTAVGQFIIVVLVSWLGYEVDEEQKTIIIDQTILLGGGLGVVLMALLTIWSRIRADKTIALKTKPTAKLPG
jgi:uncharacterized membrane protein